MLLFGILVRIEGAGGFRCHHRTRSRFSQFSNERLFESGSYLAQIICIPKEIILENFSSFGTPVSGKGRTNIKHRLTDILWLDGKDLQYRGENIYCTKMFQVSTAVYPLSQISFPTSLLMSVLMPTTSGFWEAVITRFMFLGNRNF